MKRAKVFISNTLAAILTEDEAGYEFMYLPECLASNPFVSGPTSDRKYTATDSLSLPMLGLSICLAVSTINLG